MTRHLAITPLCNDTFFSAKKVYASCLRMKCDWPKSIIIIIHAVSVSFLKQNYKYTEKHVHQKINTDQLTQMIL